MPPCILAECCTLDYAVYREVHNAILYIPCTIFIGSKTIIFCINGSVCNVVPAIFAVYGSVYNRSICRFMTIYIVIPVAFSILIEASSNYNVKTECAVRCCPCSNIACDHVCVVFIHCHTKEETESTLICNEVAVRSVFQITLIVSVDILYILICDHRSYRLFLACSKKSTHCFIKFSCCKQFVFQICIGIDFRECISFAHERLIRELCFAVVCVLVYRIITCCCIVVCTKFECHTRSECDTCVFQKIFYVDTVSFEGSDSSHAAYSLIVFVLLIRHFDHFFFCISFAL